MAPWLPVNWAVLAAPLGGTHGLRVTIQYTLKIALGAPNFGPLFGQFFNFIELPPCALSLDTTGTSRVAISGG